MCVSSDAFTHTLKTFEAVSLLRGAFTLALVVLLGSVAEVDGQLGNDPRSTLDLSGPPWRFYKGQPAGEPWLPAFNHSRWPVVAVPHTWNNIDGTDGPATPYYRGVAWYRRTFRAPPPTSAGQRFVLQFDGVALTADVFVGGRWVGAHAGGYARFRVDVTEAVAGAGDRNAIPLAVKVSNAKSADIIPRDGDFTIYGGIYRGVSLFTTASVHISTFDFASPGVYIRQFYLDATVAHLEVTVKLDNDSPLPVSAAVSVRAENRAGRAVASAQSGVLQLPALSRETSVRITLTIKRPRRWHGTLAPYLYRLIAGVQVGTGPTSSLVDSVTQSFGLRTVRVDDAEGFFLNDLSYPIRGVNKHQDRDPVGSAVLPEDHYLDMGLLEELGANAHRTHYQMDQVWYDLCDRRGVMVWAELPLVNLLPKNTSNAVNQLQELIRQNYNHPSIVVWGLGNEIFKFRGAAGVAHIVPVLSQLAHVAKREDPDRLTGYAHRMSDGRANRLAPVDVIGFNAHYRQQHVLEGLSSALEENLNVGLTEWGAGGQVDVHGWTPSYDTEESQASWLEVMLPFLAAPTQRFLFGHFLFQLTEQGSDERTWQLRRGGVGSTGLVTFDRKTRKDAFFFVKSQWSQKPFVYITSRRFNPHPDMGRIKVYSNAGMVKVTINGAPLGPPPVVSNGAVYLWPNVTLPRGKVQVKATARAGVVFCQDLVVWDVRAAASVPDQGRPMITVEGY